MISGLIPWLQCGAVQIGRLGEVKAARAGGGGRESLQWPRNSPKGLKGVAHVRI